MPDYKAILSGQSWNSLSSLKDSKKPVFLTYTFNPSSFFAPSGWSKFKSADKALARKALQMWGDASGIRFIEVKGANAELKFQWQETWQDFTAWAEFPELNRATFDDEGLVRDYSGGNVYLNTLHRDELARNESYKLWVLLHEIGHALGLKHPFHKMDHNKQLLNSNLDHVNHTVMSYTGGDENMLSIGLGSLDIQAIRALYGSPSQDGRQVAKWSWSKTKQTLTQVGKSKADVIYGVAVKDIVKGGRGDDKVYSFDGNDILYGEAGNDFLSGSDGDDILYGDVGNDVLRGGYGDDKLHGGTGSDALSGGDGDDILYGHFDNDVLKGGDGNDALDGSDGSDTLDGAGDRDILQGGAGSDLLSGGNDDDTLYGDMDNDVLRGDFGWDVLHGGAGNDELDGGDGIDTLKGGAGSDILKGGEGDDQFVFDTPFNGIDDIDLILDFDIDKIVLSSAIFTTLTKGFLSPMIFVDGPAAMDLDDRILFNFDEQSLSYDLDGSGPAAAVRFAKFQKSVTVYSYDFLVV